MYFQYIIYIFKWVYTDDDMICFRKLRSLKGLSITWKWWKVDLAKDLNLMSDNSIYNSRLKISNNIIPLPIKFY